VYITIIEQHCVYIIIIEQHCVYIIIIELHCVYIIEMPEICGSGKPLRARSLSLCETAEDESVKQYAARTSATPSEKNLYAFLCSAYIKFIDENGEDPLN